MLGAEIEKLIRQIVREELSQLRTDGETCESIRLQRNLSREQLSEIAGISVNAIYRIERGLTKDVRPHTVRKLAAALACPHYARLIVNARKSA